MADEQVAATKGVETNEKFQVTLPGDLARRIKADAALDERDHSSMIRWIVRAFYRLQDEQEMIQKVKESQKVKRSGSSVRFHREDTDSRQNVND